MITICINGSPGSGKTTLANNLLSSEKTFVVHCDQLLNRLKEVLVGNNIKKVYREHDEVSLFLDRDGLFFKLLHAKYIENIYEYLRMKYVKRELKKLMIDAENAGYKYFIVEGLYTTLYDDVCYYDFKIFLRSQMSERKKRIEFRDRLTEQPFDFNDYVTLSERNVNLYNYNYIIDNDESLEEYYKIISQIGDSIKQQSLILQIQKKLI